MLSDIVYDTKMALFEAEHSAERIWQYAMHALKDGDIVDAKRLRRSSSLWYARARILRWGLIEELKGEGNGAES